MYIQKILKEKLLQKLMDYIKSQNIIASGNDFCCPFCYERIMQENLLSASLDADNKNFTCSECGMKGNIFTLYRKFEGNGTDEEILKVLAERFNIYAELSNMYLDVIDAKELSMLELTPLKPIVGGLISQGLNILAGSPKIGKSFLVLWLCLQVAKGDLVWNYETLKGTTLYLSLEDNLVRLQDRLNKITDIHPENMFFATQSKKIKGGLDVQIENFIAEHKDVVLIVLDTFQKVRENAKDFGNIYANDYDDMCYLKTIADKHEIAILIVHHTRKMTDSDPFNMISGSTGISGAADSMISLIKDNRMDGSATLQVTGRDTDDKKLLIRFNKEIFLWDMVSNDADETLRQQEIDRCPIMKSIVSLTNDTLKWSGTATQLLKALTTYSGELPKAPNALSQKLNSYEHEFKKRGILYSKLKSGDSRTITLEKEIAGI